MICEITSGHFINLTAVIEIDDNPDTGECFVLLPAPTWDGQGGPHGVLLKGEIRDLVLGWARREANRTRMQLVMPFGTVFVNGVPPC